MADVIGFMRIRAKRDPASAFLQKPVYHRPGRRSLLDAPAKRMSRMLKNGPELFSPPFRDPYPSLGFARPASIGDH